MAQLAADPAVGRIECRNLLATDEACVEWHATYRDRDGDEWQLDMIHIVRGSRYDGYFERVADRIAAALTPVTRRAILQLKYDTPDDVKIAGIEYYVAVLRDGVRTYDAFAEWRRTHPLTGIVEWMPWTGPIQSQTGRRDAPYRSAHGILSSFLLAVRPRNGMQKNPSEEKETDFIW